MATASDQYDVGTIFEHVNGTATYVKLEDANGEQRWRATYQDSRGSTAILHFDLPYYVADYKLVKAVRKVVPIKPTLPAGTVLADASGYTVFIKDQHGGWNRFYGGKKASYFEPSTDPNAYPANSLGGMFHIVDLTAPPKDAA